MAMPVAVPTRRTRPLLQSLNEEKHAAALGCFMLIVLAHWVEHIVQAIQIWGLGWKRPAARGVLGMAWPWLVKSEALHYGYALVMLLALFALRKGFTGPARSWWNLALVIQFWHHIEHLLLIIQANTHDYFFGGKVPTSVLQVFFPRVELHLFYNTIVTIPLLVAVALYMRDNKRKKLLLAGPSAGPAPAAA